MTGEALIKRKTDKNMYEEMKEEQGNEVRRAHRGISQEEWGSAVLSGRKKG